MDKSLKIVLSILALYAVLSIQFLVEKGVFIIPYEFNPIVIWLVSGLIVLTSVKQPNFKNNVLYFVGISVYCLLSERTLNVIHNQTDDVRFFIDIIQNPFTRLISILGLLFAVLSIAYNYVKHKFGIYLLVLAVLSGVFGLMNFHYAYIGLFTLYTLCFLLAVNFSEKLKVNEEFSSIVNQLFLFTILEGIFSFII
jgi:hypothetical protein